MVFETTIRRTKNEQGDGSTFLVRCEITRAFLFDVLLPSLCVTIHELHIRNRVTYLLR